MTDSDRCGCPFAGVAHELGTLGLSLLNLLQHLLERRLDRVECLEVGKFRQLARVPDDTADLPKNAVGDGARLDLRTLGGIRQSEGAASDAEEHALADTERLLQCRRERNHIPERRDTTLVPRMSAYEFVRVLDLGFLASCHNVLISLGELSNHSDQITIVMDKKWHLRKHKHKTKNTPLCLETCSSAAARPPGTRFLL